MKTLKQLDAAIATVEKIVLLAAVAVMVTLVFAQVVARLFTGDFIWANALSKLLMIVICFLGVSLATRSRKHIRIDTLTRFLGPRGRTLAAVIGELAALLLCIYLARVGAFLVATNYALAEVASKALQVPAWAVQVVIPLGFSIIALRFFIRFLEDLRSLADGGPSS